MFVTAKRHEREKQELVVSSRLIDAILKYSDQGLFLLGRDKLLPQVSRALATMFRRQDFSNLTFEKLLAPIVSAKTLTIVRSHIAALLGGSAQTATPGATNTLKDIEVRLANPDGSHSTAHYWFDFDPVDIPGEPKVWLVRVTDITMQVQTLRELEELRSQSQAQGEVLRGVLQRGGARFGAFLQKTDAAMKTINTVLKKSARAEDAFRHKLEQTLEEVDRIRREAAAFRLSALEGSARTFEDALQELRSRTALSGSDFLPLAVKLDHLYGQFALIKSLGVVTAPSADAAVAAHEARLTEKGTLIIEAPRFTSEFLSARATGGEPPVNAPPAPAPATAATTTLQAVNGSGRSRNAPAGSLDSALQSLTDHVAQEQKKEVLLESRGLQAVPSRYQAAVKNVAIQLIRNAVMHGIEPAAVREAQGKAVHGLLRLEFRALEQGYELLFEDDGCGLDPDQVRATAIQRGVVTREAATRMRDREAIKLIFKSRYTTLGGSPGDTTHGAGMSLVRRYVHEAGGKIALASLAGHETRFKISLPALPEDVRAASDASPPADDARVA